MTGFISEMPGGRNTTVNQPKPRDQRRIVGLLVTYTWKPEGEVFFVREGRTKIGRDDRECEVVIPNDGSLSRENTTIIYRAGGSGTFRVSDKESMGGTWVNGVVIETEVQLENYSTIRAGATTWIFIAVNPQPARVDAPVAAQAQAVKG
jgi:pSer/pThr/pTyr-binding forkhead associated (FHA) protein